MVRKTKQQKNEEHLSKFVGCLFFGFMAAFNFIAFSIFFIAGMIANDLMTPFLSVAMIVNAAVWIIFWYRMEYKGNKRRK